MATSLDPGIAPIWPITVSRYHAMIDAGILGPDDPVELLEGVIVQEIPKYAPHRIATRAARVALGREIPEGMSTRRSRSHSHQANPSRISL